MEHFDLGLPRPRAPRELRRREDAGGSQYRIGGVPRRMCLGTYPAVSLIEARDAWRAARIAVAKGIDPAAREDVSRRDTFAVAVARVD